MVSLRIVRESNKTLAASPDGDQQQIALFVGATQGIGLSTLTEFVRHTVRATKVYIVGRNDAALNKIVEDLQVISSGSVVFVPIKAEIALLKNIDAVCAQLAEREERLDLLFMAQGYLKYKRIDNAEGLEDTMSLRYYGRMRFIQQLLPLLTRAKAGRVVSLQGAGKEGKLLEADLELQHNFSMMQAAVHTNTMNSLAVQHLAGLHPNVAFLHCFPGLVETGAFATTAKDWNFFLRWLFLYVLLPLSRPLQVSLKECGERQVFHATSARYPARTIDSSSSVQIGAMAPMPTGLERAKGWDGSEGNGWYLVDWNGETPRNGKLMAEYQKENMSKKVWDHTLEIFDRVSKKKA